MWGKSKKKHEQAVGRRDVSPLRADCLALPFSGIEWVPLGALVILNRSGTDPPSRQNVTCARGNNNFRYKEQVRLECQEEVTR